MLLIRWLQNILLGPLVGSTPRVQEGAKAPGAVRISATGAPGAASTASGRPDGKLLDVVHEALREEADELADMVARGVPAVHRRRLRQRVRRRVAKSMHPAFDSPEVVEEVTERLVSAAEVDPYYTRLFEDD